MTNSAWETYFENQLIEAKLPQWEREYRFIKPRRFRFDFAWPTIKFAVEVEGAVFSGGRHTRGAGYTTDCVKYALAAIEGYRIIRATTGQVSNGEAIQWVKDYFGRQVNGIS